MPESCNKDKYKEIEMFLPSYFTHVSALKFTLVDAREKLTSARIFKNIICREKCKQERRKDQTSFGKCLYGIIGWCRVTFTQNEGDFVSR